MRQCHITQDTLESRGELAEPPMAGPLPQFLIQQVWDGAGNTAFLIPKRCYYSLLGTPVLGTTGIKVKNMGVGIKKITGFGS